MSEEGSLPDVRPGARRMERGFLWGCGPSPPGSVQGERAVLPACPGPSLAPDTSVFLSAV